MLKFRVWDGNKKRWLNDWMINNHGVVVNDRDDAENLSLHDNAIIQQYTGCNDKNRNPVYEGDVIKHTNLGMTRNGTIRFYAGAFFAEWEDQTDDMLGYLLTTGIEVIGNIFENKK